MIDNSLEKSLELSKQCNTSADISSKSKTKSVDKLVKEVLSLNPKCTDIGEGKLNYLIELAKEIEGGR